MEIIVIKIYFKQDALVQFFVRIQIKTFVIKSEHIALSCVDFLTSTLLSATSGNKFIGTSGKGKK